MYPRQPTRAQCDPWRKTPCTTTPGGLEEPATPRSPWGLPESASGYSATPDEKTTPGTLEAPAVPLSPWGLPESTGAQCDPWRKAHTLKAPPTPRSLWGLPESTGAQCDPWRKAHTLEDRDHLPSCTTPQPNNLCLPNMLYRNAGCFTTDSHSFCLSLLHTGTEAELHLQIQAFLVTACREVQLHTHDSHSLGKSRTPEAWSPVRRLQRSPFLFPSRYEHRQRRLSPRGFSLARQAAVFDHFSSTEG